MATMLVYEWGIREMPGEGNWGEGRGEQRRLGVIVVWLDGLAMRAMSVDQVWKREAPPVSSREFVLQCGW